MITLPDYVGMWFTDKKWLEPATQQFARELLLRVNALLDDISIQYGIIARVNPKTHTQVSGETFGGFRPQSCPIGAPESSHKVGMGVDVFDHDGVIDKCLDDHPELLDKHDLYREAPSATPGWCHLQTRKTKSGKRTFLP